MVQVVEIPLEWANSIPGVSGIRDVEFRVPEVGDIVDPILADVPSVEDIQRELLAALLDAEFVRPLIDEFADQLDPGEPLVQTFVEAVAAEVVEQTFDVEDIEFPTPDEIAVEIGDQLDLSNITTIEVDIEGSLFDIEQDLVPLVEQVFETADLSGLAPDLPFVEDLITFLETAVPAVERFDEQVAAFLADPLGTATRLYLDLLLAVVEEADLVSDDVRTDLEETLEGP